MKLFFLLLLLISYTSRTQVFSELNVEYYHDSLTTNVLNQFQLSLQQIEAKFQKSLSDSISSQSKKLTIDDYYRLKRSETDSLIDQKYQFGNLALDQMQNASSIIQFMGELVDVEIAVNISTALWTDKNLRNFWDEIQTWGSIIGIGVAATSPFVDDKSNKSVLSGGLGLVLSTQLFGRIFGNSNSNRLKEKIQFFEFSRQAYDALLSRQQMVQYFVATASDFRQRLKALSASYTSANTTQQKKEMILTLKNYLNDFQIVLTLVPTYLESFISLKGYYFVKQEKSQLSEDMQVIHQLIHDAIQRSEIVLKRYKNEVQPILNLSPKVRAVLDL